MKIIDVIGVVLIVLGISMTVLNFLAARRSIACRKTIRFGWIVLTKRSSPSRRDFVPRWRQPATVARRQAWHNGTRIVGTHW